MKDINPSQLGGQNKVLVKVSELMLGMYICELDKPWKDSPFIFQGFIIQSQEVLQQVRDECSYVYVDIARQSLSIPVVFTTDIYTDKAKNKTVVKLKKQVKPKTKTKTVKYKKASIFHSVSSRIKRKLTKKRIKNVLEDIVGSNINAEEIIPPEKINTFEQEIEKAQEVHVKTSQVIHHYMRKVKNGGVIDMQVADKAVQACIRSVLRSPDAMMLMTHLKAKDNNTWQHSMNTCVLAIAFGRYLSLEDEELVTLGLCGMLHDIGKLQIPDEILNKSTGLDPEENKILQSHTLLGKSMLSSFSKDGGSITDILNNSATSDSEQSDVKTPDAASGKNVLKSCPTRLASIIAEVAHCHHERLDGGGYPRGITSNKISPFSKIIAIVDTYDTLTTDRSYQHGKTHLGAIDILLNQVNSHFDETLVNCFIQSLGTYPAGSAIEMTTGEIGVVIEVNEQQKLRPKVILISDEEQQPQNERVVDLAQTYEDALGNPYSIKTIIRPDAYNVDISKYYKYGVIQKSIDTAA